MTTCSVESCDTPMCKKSARGMCTRHYQYWLRTGSPTKPCAGCGEPLESRFAKYCSEPCKPRCSVEGCDGPVRKRTWCASHYHQAHLSGADPRGKRGQLRQTSTKLCRPCKQDNAKYRMSARELARRDGTNCGICSLPVDMTLTRADGTDCPSVDHIKPKAVGGTHDPNNLQLAHLVCNMRKNDRYEEVTA